MGFFKLGKIDKVYGSHPGGEQPQYLAAPPHLPQLNPEANTPGQLAQVTPTSVKYERVYMEAPVPRYPGGRELQYMPPMEMNVTRGPCGYLDVDSKNHQTKEWYNTWLYVPEPVRGGEDPQFENRFTEARITLDADGDGHTYLDHAAVERKYQFYQMRTGEAVAKQAEDEDARAGVGIIRDQEWSDAYTGAPIIEAQKRLVHQEEFMAKHGVVKRDWQTFTEYLTDGYSFDSLRVPWPFDTGERGRNKMITRSAMAFERRSPLYTGDAHFHMGEAGHSYYRHGHSD